MHVQTSLIDRVYVLERLVAGFSPHIAWNQARAVKQTLFGPANTSRIFANNFAKSLSYEMTIVSHRRET